MPGVLAGSGMTIAGVSLVGAATFSLGLGISLGGVLLPSAGVLWGAGAQPPLGQGAQQSLALRAARRARMRSSRLTRWQAHGSPQGAAAGAGAEAGAAGLAVDAQGSQQSLFRALKRARRWSIKLGRGASQHGGGVATAPAQPAWSRGPNPHPPAGTTSPPAPMVVSSRIVVYKVVPP